MGDGLSTIICLNTSTSTGTISGASRGQVEARWSAQEGLGVGAMGVEAREAEAGARAGGGTATCLIAEP